MSKRTASNSSVCLTILLDCCRVAMRTLGREDERQEKVKVDLADLPPARADAGVSASGPEVRPMRVRSTQDRPASVQQTVLETAQ
jgi:hypothetical protein